MVRAKHDWDPLVLYIGGDDGKARIAFDQRGQTSREEIIEALDDYGYARPFRHRPGRGRAPHLVIGRNERKGEPRLPLVSPEDHASGGWSETPVRPSGGAMAHFVLPSRP